MLRHPNIALLLAVCCGPAKADMFLALEPLIPSSLHHQIHKEHQTLSYKEIANTMTGVASGEGDYLCYSPLDMSVVS